MNETSPRERPTQTMPAPSIRPRHPSRAKKLAESVGRLRTVLRSGATGPWERELREAQRSVVLQRTVVLIWVSVFVMPTTCLSYVWFAWRPAFGSAVWIVGAAVAAVLVHRLLIRARLFDRHYHLAMLILVAGVFGPTGSAIMEITRASSADFFFAFFLIFFAFTALFPADATWILLTSLGLIASFTLSRAFRPDGLVFDQALINSIIYLGQLTFIGLVLNRVLCRLFFDEKRAQLALQGARDALFAEMEVARDIQTLLLPKSLELPGHVASGLMIPATEVGGDYYDVLVAPGGRRFIAIGDVSGHGVTAGLTMMMTRASLLGTLEADPRAKLPVLYAALNRCLRSNLERMGLSLYMTFALLEDRGQGRFDAVGGHLPALIFRRGPGEVEEVEMAGVWLGVLDEIPLDVLPVTELELAQGDSLLLVTDGVVERMSDVEMFGFERLKESFASAAPRGPAFTIEAVVRAVEAHSSRQDDDLTLVAIECAGARREAAS
jgi:hypothetical protein